jgi:hypothetical protein
MKRNRDHLKQEFQDGERPSGQDFTDLIESIINQEDDGVTVDPDHTVRLTGGLLLGNPQNGVDGMLRFDGNAVQLHDGNAWGPLVPAAGPSGAFQPVTGGPHVAFADGNVGIGTFASAPTFQLEVNLDANTGTTERVRFGEVTLSNGTAAFAGYAQLAHRSQSSNSGFALRQSGDGATHVNAAAGQILSLRQGGTNARLALSSTGNVIVHGETDLVPGAHLQVSGGAYVSGDLTITGQAIKPGGGAWSLPSDLRLKQDVRDFERGLDDLVRVRPVRFRYNGKAETPKDLDQVGIVAQELEQIFPSMVRRVSARLDDETSCDDLRIYNGSELVYVMVNAIKELAGRVEQLEAALEVERRRGTES